MGAGVVCAGGLACGGTAGDFPAAGEPATFTATTLNVYVVFEARPVIVAVVVVASTLAFAPPGDAVTTYFVHGAPPSLVGFVHEIVAPPYPAVAVTACGALGTFGWTALMI